MNIRRWVMAACVVVSLAQAEELGPASVRGERVNVRARPSLQAEVVGQLDEPATVAVRGVSNDWAEIVPPSSFDLYVHKDFVQGGVVSASKLVVRAGPGINYSKVGELHRGDSVVVRGEFGEWLKIAPPTNCSLWIARSMIKLPEPPRPAEPPRVATVRPSPQAPLGTTGVSTGAPPAVAGTVQPSRPSSPPTAPPAMPASPPGPVVPPPVISSAPAAPPQLYTPDDLRLAPVENQGISVQREGRVRSTMLTLGRPSRFVLVDETAGGSEIIGYLRGNEAQLRSFLDRRLRIRGRQYWVQGSRHPVIVVDQIAVMPD